MEEVERSAVETNKGWKEKGYQIWQAVEKRYTMH
jgi:hypothetical protein